MAEQHSSRRFTDEQANLIIYQYEVNGLSTPTLGFATHQRLATHRADLQRITRNLQRNQVGCNAIP